MSGPQKDLRWPVRIHTLGRFAVILRDKPLFIGSQVQTKPLELLRKLIALGGRGVAVDKLAQELRPNTTEKAAKHALETTLYRLRKLLGDRCVEMKSGCLTIDADYCWVDIWSVEQLFDTAEQRTSPVIQMKELFELYQGPFLESDDAPYVLIQRERLHSKFLRAVGQIGGALLSSGEHERAIECYQRGIEADPMAEELYRCLMRCFYELGRSAEAMAVYWRCQKTLTCILGVEPSIQTEMLYQEIQGQSKRPGLATPTG